MEIGIADWQTKLKFNCIRTGARSEGKARKEEKGRRRQSLAVPVRHERFISPLPNNQAAEENKSDERHVAFLTQFFLFEEGRAVSPVFSPITLTFLSSRKERLS
jgi:hypothetical protein